jgi:ribose transport system substrate-binding protein
MTDGTDRALAKRNAETAATIYPDLAAVAGLWSYNTPQALEGLKNKGKLGTVKVFGFDEEIATLKAIADGTCEGTIVQQPFEFGYQSMKNLKAVLDGQPVSLNEAKEVPVPAKTITKETVADFQKLMIDLKAQGEAAADYQAPAGAPKFAFIINNNSDFWSYARAGLKKAEKEFGIVADFQAPPTGTLEEQNRIISSILLKKDEYKGVAISPVEPANQTDIINKAAAELPFICHDSDAPKSNRRFYVGTNNVDAGRLLGKLIKQRLPQGGKIVLFVGSIDALNAKQRREGLIDELSKP